jgi:hypothetical protein
MYENGVKTTTAGNTTILDDKHSFVNLNKRRTLISNINYQLNFFIVIHTLL